MEGQGIVHESRIDKILDRIFGWSYEHKLMLIVIFVMIAMIISAFFLIRGYSSSSTTKTPKTAVASSTTASKTPVPLPSTIVLKAPGIESQIGTLSLSVLSLESKMAAATAASTSAITAQQEVIQSVPVGETSEQRFERFLQYVETRKKK